MSRPLVGSVGSPSEVLCDRAHTCSRFDVRAQQGGYLVPLAPCPPGVLSLANSPRGGNATPRVRSTPAFAGLITAPSPPISTGATDARSSWIILRSQLSGLISLDFVVDFGTCVALRSVRVV